MRWKWFIPGRHFLLMVAQEMLPTWGTHSYNSCIASFPGSLHAYCKWRHDNFWYDVIFIVTVYTSQGYRPEWEHRGYCLHPCHVLWEVLCRTHAGRGEDSQQYWKHRCPWAGTYLQHGSWWRHSWVVILGSNTFCFKIFTNLQYTWQNQNGKFELEGTVILISRCYIASPTYKASLLPSVLLSVEQNE